ncbi:hypothetical protein JBO49_03970 [Serratia fonticola]|uniref:hypothetical protein n=1 Tax=Serratia fonticola TaxID=47917 RepID=UPI00192C4893|nr:hypothetical protein [Serratia fonticola]MBL5859771.1 hypothetical protein [Serratia fonticola]
MEFGLACEGITDQVVLRNILIGHFRDEDLFDNTSFLQPPFDETTKKQSDFSNWTLLLKYLKSEKFRDDTYNFDFLVIQVDTDVSAESGFDVSHYDENNELISDDLLIQNTTNRLIKEINAGQQCFYEENSEKIIFSLSVHSIECWLLAFYATGTKAKKKVNCFSSLEFHLSKKIDKNHDSYVNLSVPFTKKKNIINACENSFSLSFFIERLNKITY